MILADATSTFISLGIGVGVLIAFVFELAGVVRNARAGRNDHGMETITEYVRWGVKHSIVLRVLIGLFVLSLFGHFMWGGPLLP